MIHRDDTLTEGNKRICDVTEVDIASSVPRGGGEMLPPALAEVEGRRGSGEGSVTATSPAHAKRKTEVVALEAACELQTFSCCSPSGLDAYGCCFLFFRNFCGQCGPNWAPGWKRANGDAFPQFF